MSPRFLFITFLALAVLMSACANAYAAGPSGVAVVTPTPVADPEKWREDLKFLATQLRTKHPNPFYKTPEAEFQRAVDELDAAIPKLTRDDIVAGFIRIAAMIDGHTQIFFGRNSVGFHLYPLRLYDFSDGLYVIDATDAYREVIGARLVKIGDAPIADAYERISPFASRDNASTVKLDTPIFLMVPEMLHAQGLIPSADAPQFVFEKADGTQVTVNPTPVSTGEYLGLLPGTFYAGLPKADAPLTLQNRDKAFWYKVLTDTNTLYIQYNQVRASTPADGSLLGMADEIRKLVTDRDFARVVVDVRHNGGGDNTTYWSMLNLLKDNPRINQRGKLFLITGRQTFSAAANFSTEVARETDAIVAGEPMGGSPNLYGDTIPYILPNSKVEVDISARTWIKSFAGDPRFSIEPQIPVELSSQDYFAKRDPVMDAILKYKPQGSNEISPTQKVVSFKNVEGATMTGTVYGQGTTAIIFSNMGANHQSDWTKAAERVAQRGYSVLTYDNSYWVTPTRIQDDLRINAPDDLRAAITFMRGQGAQRMVLVGASLGAMDVIKVAPDTNPAAAIIMASSIDQTDEPFLVTSDDIRAIAAPKLFVVSEHDILGYTDDIEKMNEVARAPKALAVIPGSAHGADIFKTAQGEALINRILAFLDEQAPIAYTGVRVGVDAKNAPMVYVPHGSFVMGSDAVSPRAECEASVTDKTQCAGDWYVPEMPTHTVMLDPFWIDQTEVTNEQYAACVADGKCSAPAKTGSLTRATYYGDPAFKKYPVIWTSWDEANTFCAWRGARLPTEAEWEKAARSDDGRLYPWGNEFAPDKAVRANFCDSNCTSAGANANFDDKFADTAPVGNYPQGASIYGALDMAGNVDEWVNDWYLPNYYQFSPRDNPQGPAPTKQHVIRGGSFQTPAFELRTAARQMVEESGDSIGFRCASATIE